MKKIVFFLAILINVVFINAQTTAIPDPNFELALINLGYDSGPIDGVVLTSNISGIDSLNVFALGISSLTGIEDFTSLTKLICSNNQLTSINLTQNTALTYLDCYNNQLTNIDLTQNTALTNFFCKFNQLTSLDFSQNTAITNLDFSNNQLTSINLTQCIALNNLICNINQLTSLDVTQNTVLTDLECKANQLTSLDLTQNIALTDFDCSFNQLTSIDLTQNTNITRLTCELNQLTSLDVSQNMSLLYLGLTANQLTSLDVTQNIALIGLGLTGNQLTSLDVTQNTALTSLDLQDNLLTSLDVSQTALNYLRCDDNQLGCLNIKNFDTSGVFTFSVINNPSLTCVEVDNVAWATINLTNIDAQSSFSTNCNNSCTVGVNEYQFPNLSLYPNPTTGSITIDLGGIKTNLNMTLINSIGQAIFTQEYESTEIVKINVDAPKGIYFLELETTIGEYKIIKIILQN
jgi:Leucine-rich repeat (LRR) protein